MDNLETVIFLDGRNFYNNLRQFAFRTNLDQRPYRLDEKHFKWQEFFHAVIDYFNSQDLAYKHRLLRVYWYNAQSITPFQENRKGAERITEDYKTEIPEITPELVTKLAKDWYENERGHFYTAKENIYENIQRKVDFLEFKGIGQYVVKPFLKPEIIKTSTGNLIYRGTRIGEKGVDLGMAVDMISKMKRYDVAIIISGDADFLPVIQYLKDQLKRVYQFSVAQGTPPQIRYLSPWLKSVCDCFGYFDEIRLLTEFLNPKGIPEAVKKAIKERIKELHEITKKSKKH